MALQQTHVFDLPGATICVLGRSFCGKGTQSEKLKEEFKKRSVPYSYTYLGSIFRRMKKEDSERGRVIRDYYDAGKFPPSWIADEIIAEGVRDVTADTATVKIFDGSPRMLEEAQFLDKQLRGLGRPQATCLYIDLPREECLKRLLTSSEDRNRDDDDAAKLNARLNEFEMHTIPVVEYYHAHGRLITIDGRGSPDEVFHRIKAKLFFV